MERIKQALQRAREERGLTGSQPRVEPSVARSSDTISYTQTRTEDVSRQRLQERRIVSAFEPGPYTEAYKILRTHVLQRLREHGWNTLAVTSPGDHEGKTLTAINLAISLAQEVGHTVLLVDADLRHPSVHTYFGLEPARGLSDYLTDEVALPELLIHPADIGRFVFLPGGRALTNSAEMLSSPRMGRLVDELKNRYTSRIVVFDLPPLLSSADALAFAPYVEAALLVVEEAATPSEEVARAAELLQKTQLIGTVLNKSLSVPKQRVATADRAPGRLGRLLGRLRKRA